jgi:spore germination protein GerM
MAVTRRYPVIALIASLLLLLALMSLGGLALAQETPTGDQPPTGQTTTPPTGQTQASPLQIYFFQNGELVGVTRDVPGGGQMVEFTVNELFKGPSEDEVAQGFSTFVPAGLKLLYSTKSMTGNDYSVNLSSELMALKDTPEQAKMAMQQIVSTLKDAAKTDSIKVTVDQDESNRGVDAITALGLNPKDLGITTSKEAAGKSSYLWLYILIILAVTLVVLAVLIPLLLSNRKAETALSQEIEEEKTKRDDKKK